MIRLLLFTFLVGVASRGATDTDIWGHLRFGLDIITSWQLPSHDPYSFTSDQRWVNHEWLCQAIYALFYRFGGVAGITLVRGALVAALLWFVSRSLKSTEWPLRDVLTASVVPIIAAASASLRPQLVSLPLYALTLLAMEKKRAWLPFVFVAWANLHAGWMLGLAMVGVHAVCRPSLQGAALFFGCAAATLVNPYGFDLWASLAEAVLRGWSDVTEWQPVSVLSLGPADFATWVAVACLALWSVLRTRPSRFQILWTLLVSLAAFRVRRHVPFFGITVVMLLASGVKGEMPTIAGNRWSRTISLVVAAWLSAVVAAVWFVLTPALTCLPPLRDSIRPEAESVSYIRAAALRGRIVTFFDWGLYAVWHVGDQLKVSLDNRRETTYSDAVVKSHLAFYAGRDPDYPARLSADYVWLPRENPAIAQLERAGWVRIFDGPRSIILSRQHRPLVSTRGSAAVSCFPEP